MYYYCSKFFPQQGLSPFFDFHISLLFVVDIPTFLFFCGRGCGSYEHDNINRYENGLAIHPYS